jgi:hypothetical protein
MRAVLVVIGNVLAEQAFQMTFIEGNDVIQQVSAAASYPALRNPVLPRTFKGSLDRANI